MCCICSSCVNPVFFFVGRFVIRSNLFWFSIWPFSVQIRWRFFICHIFSISTASWPLSSPGHFLSNLRAPLDPSSEILSIVLDWFFFSTLVRCCFHTWPLEFAFKTSILISQMTSALIYNINCAYGLSRIRTINFSQNIVYLENRIFHI